MQEWEIMNKFILPALAAAILLIPQPAEAWNQRRRNPWADFGTSIGFPFVFTLILCGGLHYTWPVNYKGNGGNR